MVKLFLAAALASAVVAVAKDDHVMERAGLLSSCAQVTTPSGSWGEWWACRAGRLSGNADLSTRSCVRMGTAAGREYWRCPESLQASRAAKT
jgi:hypothetical protein